MIFAAQRLRLVNSTASFSMRPAGFARRAASSRFACVRAGLGLARGRVCNWPRRSRPTRAAGREVDVVGIPEDQDRYAERFAEVAHLAVRYAARVQQADGVLEHLAGRDGEAHMVEPHAVLAETVPLDGARGIREGADTQAPGAVAQEGARIEVHQLLEPEQARVELHRPVEVGDGESEGVHATSRDGIGHGSHLLWPGLSGRTPVLSSTLRSAVVLSL